VHWFKLLISILIGIDESCPFVYPVPCFHRASALEEKYEAKEENFFLKMMGG
jgi:hypothetical protein